MAVEVDVAGRVYACVVVLPMNNEGLAWVARDPTLHDIGRLVDGCHVFFNNLSLNHDPGREASVHDWHVGRVCVVKSRGDATG